MYHETLKEKLQNLVTEARKIHSEERGVLIDSLRVIAKLAYWRAELYMGGKHEHGTKKIGLTPDQYFKRLRVAKLANRFPQAIQHLRDGKTCLSHLALIGDKMTEANEREAMIHRLTEVLSARGHVPTTAEAIMIAVDKLLDQRDQLRRATKMAAKDAEREVERESEVRDSQANNQDSLPQGGQTRKIGNSIRRKIPEAIKRAVFRRAEGRCQHLMPDESRCGATRMVEIDHIIPVARCGGDEESNLTLVCREHNQYRARLMMGGRTMNRYRSRRASGL